MSNRPPQIEAWLAAAIEDAERRELPDLKALLETLARSTAALRAAEAQFQAQGSRRTEQGSGFEAPGS